MSFKNLKKEEKKNVFTVLYLPTYLLFLTLFISSCGFMLLSGVISFQVWRTSFSISCQEDLLVMNSSSLHCWGNIFALPSFLKDSFAVYRLVDIIFSFNTLDTSSHCLWPPLFSVRSQLLILLRFPYIWLVACLSQLWRFFDFQQLQFLSLYPFLSLISWMCRFVSLSNLESFWRLQIFFLRFLIGR